jgi:hypothetical protein
MKTNHSGSLNFLAIKSTPVAVELCQITTKAATDVRRQGCERTCGWWRGSEDETCRLSVNFLGGVIDTTVAELWLDSGYENNCRASKSGAADRKRLRVSVDPNDGRWRQHRRRWCVCEGEQQLGNFYSSTRWSSKYESSNYQWVFFLL